MQWKTMTKRQAKKQTEKWNAEGEKAFYQAAEDLNFNRGNLSSEYRTLRSDLIKAWRDSSEEVSHMQDQKSRKIYLKDLLFARKLYLILQERGMDIRFASYDAVWIYLSMAVVPEITYERFGKKKKDSDKEFRIPQDHYFVKSVRIYLKSLWWYIFLSLRFDDHGHEDLDATVNMLWDQNTDTLLQFVERAGSEGYRVDVYREIIKYYCEHSDLMIHDFRKVMILNTARCQVSEPALCESGIQGYVRRLYGYFGK